MRVNSENQKKREAGSSMDKIKWVVILFLIAFVVWGNFYFADANSVYQANSIVRSIAIIVISALALFLAATTQKGRSFLGFAKESRGELRKVVWPTRKETVQTTLLVAVITIVVGLFLWGLDTFFFWLVSFLTTLGH